MVAAYTGKDVDAVLSVVETLSHDIDTRMTIMAHALVVILRACGVSKEEAFQGLEVLWASDATAPPGEADNTSNGGRILQ